MHEFRQALSRRPAHAAGFSFIELMVATFVMLVLASAALPLARVSIKRQRERDLKSSLREMRAAIDRFKELAERNQIAPSELQTDSEQYPTSLEQLVEGVGLANDASGRKLKLLRRIPIDPITGRSEWGMRSYQDLPDAKVWGGQNIFDVYSKAEGIALDGTKYRDW